MSRFTQYTVAIAAALLFGVAAPGAAQSNDDGASDRDRPTETRQPQQKPERPSLRRRPPPSDTPEPRRPEPQPRPQGDNRDTQSRSSALPGPAWQDSLG